MASSSMRRVMASSPPSCLIEAMLLHINVAWLPLAKGLGCRITSERGRPLQRSAEVSANVMEMEG
eukprot:m.175838 g.175838  ORF g.175838 m.175838 type:complete len:65 (-) comp16551_c1_seq3:64-258(-)